MRSPDHIPSRDRLGRAKQAIAHVSKLALAGYAAWGMDMAGVKAEYTEAARLEASLKAIEDYANATSKPTPEG